MKISLVVFSENMQKSFSSKQERKFSSSEGRRPSLKTAESSVPKQEEDRQHELTSNKPDEMEL